jgi:hypothetical protein
MRRLIRNYLLSKIVSLIMVGTCTGQVCVLEHGLCTKVVSTPHRTTTFRVIGKVNLDRQFRIRGALLNVSNNS